MTTLKFFSAQNIFVPASISRYLADLGEFRGKQELYTQQSPQRLKTLREHALIESAVSSNRIEDVSVDPSRVRDVLVAAKPLFRDREIKVSGSNYFLNRKCTSIEPVYWDEARTLAIASCLTASTKASWTRKGASR